MVPLAGFVGVSLYGFLAQRVKAVEGTGPGGYEGNTTRRRFLGIAGSALAAAQVEARLLAQGEPPVDTNHLLWFDALAAQWADALPVDNGRLGGMVFGHAKKERIALNEDTLWSGFPRSGLAPEPEPVTDGSDRAGPSIWPGGWNNPIAWPRLAQLREEMLQRRTTSQRPSSRRRCRAASIRSRTRG